MTEVDNRFVTNLRRLPKDIIDIVFSYYYSSQPQELCIDIKDYSYSRIFLNEIYKKRISKWGYHTSNWILIELLVHEIYNYCNNYFARRRLTGFIFHCKKLRICDNWDTDKITYYMDHCFINKHMRSQVNILWGILTPFEREHVVELATKKIHMPHHHMLIDIDEEDDVDF